MLWDEHEAEDAAHEALLEAVQSRSRYDPRRGTLERWLFGIARMVALGRLRKLRRIESQDPARIHARLEAEQRISADASPVELPDPILETVITRLRPAQRQVFMLRAIGLSTDEIASILERNPAWVYKTEQRGGRFVKERLRAVEGATATPRGRRAAK